MQRKAERLEMLIKRLSLQQSIDDAAEEEEETDSKQPHPSEAPPTSQSQKQEVSVPRPPRLKPFSIRGLIKKLWNDRSGGTKNRKVEGPLPSRVNTGKSKTTRRLMSSPDPLSQQRYPAIERREKRSMTTSLATPDAPSFSTLPAEKRASLPNVSQHQHEAAITMIRRHRRLGSDDLKGKTMFNALSIHSWVTQNCVSLYFLAKKLLCSNTQVSIPSRQILYSSSLTEVPNQVKDYMVDLLSLFLSLSLSAARVAQLLTVDMNKDSSGSCPSSPRSKHQTLPTGSVSPHHQPIIHRASLQHPTPHSQMRAKQRSWSDLRSPSPQKQLLPSFSKCMCVCVCVCV